MRTTAMAQLVVACTPGGLEMTTIDKFGSCSCSCPASWEVVVVVLHVEWVALSGLRSRSHDVCSILTVLTIHEAQRAEPVARVKA